MQRDPLENIHGCGFYVFCWLYILPEPHRQLLQRQIIVNIARPVHHFDQIKQEQAQVVNADIIKVALVQAIEDVAHSLPLQLSDIEPVHSLSLPKALAAILKFQITILVVVKYYSLRFFSLVPIGAHVKNFRERLLFTSPVLIAAHLYLLAIVIEFRFV